ncbi:MAG: hypothetical protein ACXQTT_02600 [Candidatus Syntropharchaeia archaeon]
MLSPCDYIRFDDGWYHIKDVTITLILNRSNNKTSIEFQGGYEGINSALDNPNNTQWREIYPRPLKSYRILRKRHLHSQKSRFSLQSGY